MYNIWGYSISAALLLLGIVLWVLLAFAPAFIAHKKGYSFLLFMIIALFISFLLALAIVLLLPNKNRTISKSDEAAVDKVLEEE